MTTEEQEAAVRILLRALQIEIPEDRISALTVAYFTAMAQAQQLRGDVTRTPSASAFDAAWDSK